MFEKLKWYAVNYGLKKYLPMGIMAAMAWLGTYLIAHAGVLEQYGVTYGVWPLMWPSGQQPSGEVILIELGTLSKAAIGAAFASAAIIARIIQQHTTGTPVVQGGTRSTDPPAAELPKGELPQ